MIIQQGDISCETDRDTWYDPQRGSDQYQNGRYGCEARFDPTEPIKVTLKSSSGDYLWIDDLGVTVGDVGYKKRWNPYSSPIYKGHGEGPFTLYPNSG